MDLGHIDREADIEGEIKMYKIKIAIAVAMLVTSPALAQPSGQIPGQF